MPISIGLPDRYPFVLAAATSTFFLNTFHAYRTSKLREYSGIRYPAAYATEERATTDSKAFVFNCAQRAHANFTENLTPFLGSLLIAGLDFPMTAAVTGAVWSASRAWYLIGYTFAGPQGYRAGHVPAFFADFALKLMVVWNHKLPFHLSKEPQLIVNCIKMPQTVFRIDERTSVQNLKPFKEEIPEPTKHEVLIRIHSVSLNFAILRWLHHNIHFPSKSSLSFHSGIENAFSYYHLGDVISYLTGSMLDGIIRNINIINMRY